MEKKIKVHYAQVVQARVFDKKNKEKGYKYMVYIEDWNDEKKKYDGWKSVTVFSNEAHKAGDGIYFCWVNYNHYGRYEEFFPTDVEEILDALDSPINLS